MIRNCTYNHSEQHRLYRPLLFALLDGLTQAQGVCGEVLVMDIHNASILGSAALHDASVLRKVTAEEKREYGECVLCASRVTNVDFIGIETEEGPTFVEWVGANNIPIEVIMPAVSYLAYMECGFQPSDLLEWEDSSATLEDAFVRGDFTPLVNAIMQLCPEGINQLICYMIDMGIFPIRPNKSPRDLQEMMNNSLSATIILDWLNQVALGEGLVNMFPEEGEEPGSLAVSAESVQTLKEVLKKSGLEGTAKSATYEGNHISGYTYVTRKDDNRNRHICLFGYYPADEPKYGIMVWLQRKEQLQDIVCEEWPELGEYAANICKRVIEILLDTGDK